MKNIKFASPVRVIPLGSLSTPFHFVLATTAAMWMGTSSAAGTTPTIRPGQELRFRDLVSYCSHAPEWPATHPLRELEGKTVRILGRIALEHPAQPSHFLLTSGAAQAVNSSGNDQKVTVQVALDAAHQQSLPSFASGLIEARGMLRVGRFEEPSGHVSWLRLELPHEASPDLPTNLARGQTPVTPKRQILSECAI